MSNMQILFWGIVSYLLGSIPFGKIYGLKFKGIDIQKHGSGNIGFANACRVLGVKIGILVLMSDVLKSYLPIVAAMYFFNVSSVIILVMGAAAIIGHAFPVWLKFRGGKSIATGFGVTLAIAPQIAATGLGLYTISFYIFRKSAIASLIAASSLPLAAVLFRSDLVVYFLTFALFAIYTHRSNIKELFHD